MSRALAVLVLVAALAGGFAALAYRDTPPRLLSEAVTPPPKRGPSRDRTLPGKARRRARRAS